MGVAFILNIGPNLKDWFMKLGGAIFSMWSRDCWEFGITKWCRINALDCFLHTLDLDPDVISLGPYLIGSLNFGVSFVPQSCWLLGLAIIILNPLARPSWQALYNSPHYRDLYKFSSVARFAIVWALSTDLGHLVSTSKRPLRLTINKPQIWCNEDFGNRM